MSKFWQGKRAVFMMALAVQVGRRRRRSTVSPAGRPPASCASFQDGRPLPLRTRRSSDLFCAPDQAAINGQALAAAKPRIGHFRGEKGLSLAACAPRAYDGRAGASQPRSGPQSRRPARREHAGVARQPPLPGRVRASGHAPPTAGGEGRRARATGHARTGHVRASLCGYVSRSGRALDAAPARSIHPPAAIRAPPPPDRTCLATLFCVSACAKAWQLGCRDRTGAGPLSGPCCMP